MWFLLFFLRKKKATVFSFFLSPQTEQLFPPQHNTSLSLLLIDSRLKRSLTANFEPRVLLKTRTREREPKESSLLQRTGVKLCPPPLLSRRLLLLKMDWGKRHFRPNLYEESAGGDFYHHHLLIPPLRPRRRTTSTTRKRKREGVDAVSYTHLTLPTILRV